MTQLILNIKNERQLPFLKELLKRLEFVEIVENNSKKLTAKENKILTELDEAVDFVNKYRKGEAKAKTFNQLLNEI